MAELTSERLSNLYSRIENYSDDQILELIDSVLRPINASAPYDINRETCSSRRPKRSISDFFNKLLTKLHIIEETDNLPKVTMTVDPLDSLSSLNDLCKFYAYKYRNEIKTILRNNPQKTSYILNIIQLLAPAIAHEYSGLPALALVGAITLLCRQGIENFIRE